MRLKIIPFIILPVLFASLSCNAGTLVQGLSLLCDNGGTGIAVIKDGHLRPVITSNASAYYQTRFGTNAGSIITIYSQGSTCIIEEWNTRDGKARTLVQSRYKISRYAYSPPCLYYTVSTESNREPVQLREKNLVSGEDRLLTEITLSNAYINSLAAGGGWIYYTVNSSRHSGLYALSVNGLTNTLRLSNTVKVFGLIDSGKLLVETADIKDFPSMVTRNYDHKLLLFDMKDKTLAPLGIRYEPMAGMPFVINNGHILVPVERNRIRNQVRSFPFGYQDKDIRYILFDRVKKKPAGKVLDSNTKKMRILDAKL